MSNPSENTSDIELSQTKDRRSVSRSAFRIGSGGVFSLVAGFASQMIIAALFGAGEVMDAYMTALTIPLYANSVMLAGLSFVFIPMFVRSVEEGRADDAWRLVGTFFWLVGGIMLAVSLAIYFSAASIIGLIAPGLTPDKAELSASMLSILAFSVLMSGLGSFTTSIQNARHRFFWPAFGGAVSSVVNAVIVVVLTRSIGSMAMAWGFLAATAAQALITVIPIVRHGWPGVLPITDQRVRKTLKLVLPFVLLGVFTKITPIFERYFASGLPDGDLSYLGYAAKTARIYQGLLTATIVTAIFPVLAKQYANNGTQGLLSMSRYGLRLTTAVALPVVALGSVLAIPLISLFYERGAFTHEATTSVALIMPLTLTRVILLAMVGNLLTRIFYVTEDTRTVPIVTAMSVLLYIPMASLGSRMWGYVGLAAAEIVYALFGVVVLFALLIRRYHLSEFPPSRMLNYLSRYLAITGAVAVVAWALLEMLGAYGALVQLAVAGIVSATLYMLLLSRFDTAIATAILDIVGINRLRYSRFMQFLRRPWLVCSRFHH